MGPAVAKELIFTARVVDGTEAETLGIVSHVVDQTDSQDAAYWKALQLLENILCNVRFWGFFSNHNYEMKMYKSQQKVLGSLF